MRSYAAHLSKKCGILNDHLKLVVKNGFNTVFPQFGSYLDLKTLKEEGIS